MMSFVFCVILFETIYRLRNKLSLGHLRTPQVTVDGKVQSFTPDGIDIWVKAGKKLVIFDNLVLNLDGYERIHPGGKFNLTHNYGRDISKFFFGGYSLIQAKDKEPMKHSQAALDIVKTLVVGVIEGQEQVTDRRFQLIKKTKINDVTATFTFKAIASGSSAPEAYSAVLNTDYSARSSRNDDAQKSALVNLKKWYNDPKMIGRHFLVYSA